LVSHVPTAAEEVSPESVGRSPVDRPNRCPVRWSVGGCRLNLYRYNAEARDELLGVLRRLGPQLWIPHQVLSEFWRNRESALGDLASGVRQTLDDLDDHLDKAVATLNRWTARVALPADKRASLVGLIVEPFSELKRSIETIAEAESTSATRETNSDPVVNLLDPLLAGKVGAAPSPTTTTEAIKEGLRRIEAHTPPGFMDKEKLKGPNPELAAGDYLVWDQILSEASHRNCNVLFVTADVKEDWWRREKGEARGPRPELALELHQRCGTRLFMTRPESLLILVRRVLAYAVKDETVSEVSRVDDLTVGTAINLASRGWTSRGLQAIMKGLDANYPVQAAVIRMAAQRNVVVGRDDVYDIGEYDANRSLRGFTRPVRRITQELKDEGVVDEVAEELLSPVYDDDTVSWQQAQGFSVPTYLLPLLRDLFSVD